MSHRLKEVMVAQERDQNELREARRMIRDMHNQIEVYEQSNKIGETKQAADNPG
jgi:hypothetical protein